MRIVLDHTRREVHNCLLIAENLRDEVVLNRMLRLFRDLPVMEVVLERRPGDRFTLLRMEEIE